MWGALYVINDLKTLLSQRGIEPDKYNMDKTYMRYYLPILALTFFSLVIMICGIVSRISDKRRLQKQRDNAPVKSIIDA